MTDTIELLNAIGGDASLRHASADDLATVLEEAKASDALKAAVASGDSQLLAQELGQKPLCEPQIVHSPGREEEEEPSEEEPDESVLPPGSTGSVTPQR